MCGGGGQDICLNIEDIVDEAVILALLYQADFKDVTLLKVSTANVSLCPVSEVNIQVKSLSFILFSCSTPRIKSSLCDVYQLLLFLPDN